MVRQDSEEMGDRRRGKIYKSKTKTASGRGKAISFSIRHQERRNQGAAARWGFMAVLFI